MPTYYVSHSGSETGAGTQDDPWTLERAKYHALAAGDIVYMVGSRSTPLRGTLNARTAGSAGNPIRYRASAVCTALLASSNITNGEWFSHSDNVFAADRNLWFQTWTTATNAAIWSEFPSGTSTINEETSAQLAGASCLRMDVDSSGSMVYVNNQSIPLAALPCRITIIYRNTGAGTLQVDIRDTTTTEYVQADGSFAAALYRHTLPNSTDWTSWTSPAFTTATNAGNHRVQLLSSVASTSCYVQAVLIEYMASWFVHSVDVYKINIFNPDTDLGLLKCSVSDWSARGVDALEFVQDVDYAGTVVADQNDLAPGQFYWDSAADILYYRLASGETIDSVHFEACINQQVINCTANYSQFENLETYGALKDNILTTGVIATTHNCTAEKSWRYGVRDTGACTTNHYGLIARYNNTLGKETYISNGYLMEGAGGTANCYGMQCYENGDDGVQCNSATATLNVYGGLFYGNMAQQGTNSAGAMSCYNCTFVDKSARGVSTYHDKEVGGASRVIQGCIIISADTGTRCLSVDNGTGMTASGNFWSGGLAPHAPVEAGSTNADPLFTDESNDNYELSASSPCLGVALKWWSGANPISASGEPYPDFDIDAGGLQSAHGPFHPSNL